MKALIKGVTFHADTNLQADEAKEYSIATFIPARKERLTKCILQKFLYNADAYYFEQTEKKNDYKCLNSTS